MPIGMTREEIANTISHGLGLVLALVAVLFSAYLTYREAFVIHAWCRWCVASAIIITLIFLVSSAENVVRRPKTPLMAPEGDAV